MAVSIIQTRLMSSRAWPYPAEFLSEPDAAGFLRMGRFSGRGVILVFEWSGKVADLHENSLKYCSPNILYHVFLDAEFREPNWLGNRKQYWHSRIVPSTVNGLRLIEARRREAPIKGADYSAVLDSTEVTEYELKMLNEMIGEGIAVAVKGEPPNLSQRYLSNCRKSLRPPLFKRTSDWLGKPQ